MSKKIPGLRPVQKFSLFFFNRPKLTALLWITIIVFGILSYSTFLKREGFPSVQTPFAIAKGSYLVNDAGKVDTEVAKPLSDFLLKQEGVKQIQSQSFDNFFTVIIFYEDNVISETRSQEIYKKINEQKFLPASATLGVEPVKFGFTTRGDDVVISFLPKNGQSDTQQLAASADQAASFIKQKDLPLVQNVSIINPFEQATNPFTGQQEITQKSFDRYGERSNGDGKLYNSVVIGIDAKDGTDNIQLDNDLSRTLNELNNSPQFKDYRAVVSASYAPQIKEQVNELQKVLLEGLVAVLVIGTIVIAARASIITTVAMITVLSAAVGLLFILGYTLNTITLFALILSLSLIVDDTIIMVEAIDAERKRRKDKREILTVATGKISRAMVAATLTAALSFAPLIFVGGILGKFIRSIPITIIAALLISLFVALIFIPFFARLLLLGKKQIGEGNVKEMAAGVEEKIASFISSPMMWAKGSTKKLLSVGATAGIIGLLFISAGGFMFSKVTFNIFPSSKDSNQISINITFPPGTDIEKAGNISDKATKIATDTVGENFVKGSFYGEANIQSAILYADITPYQDREVTAPELVKKLNEKFSGFSEAQVKAAQVDAGPPAATFTARISSEKDRVAAIKLANDISGYLQSAELKRLDGRVAKLESVNVSNTSIYNRDDGKPYIEVSAKFVDTDTTTLVTLAKDAVTKEFTEERVASYGLDKNALSFDFGQEDENQDSFKTLALAFPVLLCVIYVLLAFQFRSLLQPLLIFLAIPFSLLGVTLGLYFTDNAFSFFAMLGFFALIGLSIKNTILLTDYANQARRAGYGPVDAAHEALEQRFRPLIATSLTAVFSLIPLTITSPFWEGLGVVLIFGLLSSTLLVITVFPYYYLASEFIRQRISRKSGLAWVILTIAVTYGLIKLKMTQLIILAPVASTLIVFLAKKFLKK